MPSSSTYTPIQTLTGNGSVNPLSFQNIPQTYTDLILVIYGRATSANTADQTLAYLNANTGTSNYSGTYFTTNGTSATSSRASSGTYFQFGVHPGGNSTAGNFGIEILHFMNYTNTTNFKTVLNRSGYDLNGSGEIYDSVHLWRQTAAINRIDMYTSTNNWATGTVMSLYGIGAA
jgi:hypothetical protein